MFQPGETKPFQAYATFEDITERKRAEEALQQSENRFQKMLGLIPDTISIHDPDMNIVYSNWKGFAAVPPEKRVLNTKCYKTYRGYEEICPDCKAITVLKTGKALHTEARLPDGTCVDLRVLPILDQDSNVEFFVEWVRDITDIKRSEQELRDGERLLKGIIDGVSDVLAIQYPDHSIERYNQAGYDLLGMTPEEVQGKKCFELIGRDRECEECATSKALKTGKLEQLEKYVPELGIYLDCRSNPVLDEDGNVVRIIEQLRDITERKQMEEALQQSQQYYRSIFETSGAAQVIIEEDNTISLANSRFEELTGYSREEIEGKRTWTEFVHPDDLEWMKEQHYMRRQDPSAAVQQYEFRFIDAQGRMHDIFLCADLIPNTRQSVASLLDITELKQTKQTLLESEKKWRNILVNTPQIGVSISARERIVFVNRHFLELTGWSRDEVLGRNWFDMFIPSRIREKIRKVFCEIMSRKQQYACFTYENEILTRSGEERIVSWANVLTLNAEGYPTEVTWLGIDITERKHYEEKLKHLSLHDQLTGLYNRTYLENEMQRLNRSREYPITIFSIDIDGMKLVNDMFGHEQGDRHLKLSADILQEILRASDILGRAGGDEFMVLLPGTDAQTGRKIIQRIRSRVEKYNREIQDVQLPLSLSIGMAVAEEESRDLYAVFKEADDFMYRYKLNKDVTVQSQIMRTILAALKERDFITHGHAQRLEDLCRQLGARVGLSDKQLSNLDLLAQVHDLGKVGVPEHILFKDGPLTDEEWEIMYQHPEKGYRIAMASTTLEDVADQILKHHERWDGEGYPLGLEGEEIPIECRILAIVDAYDAMTNDRPYREVLAHEDAISELKRCSGTRFDPDLVEKFIEIIQQQFNAK